MRKHREVFRRVLGQYRGVGDEQRRAGCQHRVDRAGEILRHGHPCRGLVRQRASGLDEMTGPGQDVTDALKEFVAYELTGKPELTFPALPVG